MGSTSKVWRAGWVAGGGVVAVAAGLLLEITARARRIADQAEEIAATLERSHANTTALFDLTQTNDALQATADRLRALRAESSR